MLKFFGKLDPNIVSNHANLVKLFITQFASYRTIWKKANTLFALNQEPNETLEKFTKCSKKERIIIEGIDELMIVEAFIRGVKSIHVSLIKSPPFPKDEAMAKALKYIPYEKE